ncbi:hypothetical protein IDJ77_16435 [Mucilaginibacter sp. ZT4R22]|uniref:Uncharacterized protein n=1 Tax=Mucilaginibacter pankratovii TaxID=2772110 RepID=A0ABR7WT85_9SPHI|nr:hypothetical protein [Mucilaginibacter pankratovii]MBD1365403.1 hypothetical protein [Mucilaginibacter pankratovii]
MKEQPVLTSEERQNLINLSKKLRCCLEFKLDELFQKNGFNSYLNNSYCSFDTPNSEKEFIKSIIGAKNDNKVFASSACTAVKTWYGMYNDDRIAVLRKFYSGWKRPTGERDLTLTIDIPFLFSQAFFMELATILNDARWRPICQYYHQDLNLKTE